MKKKTTLSEEDQALFRQLMAGTRKIKQDTIVHRPQRKKVSEVPVGFAPIFPDICYHLPHYKPAAADIPVASDNPAHYADA
ncbi:hypothetical protein ACWJT1_08360, partial [Escherichia coli]